MSNDSPGADDEGPREDVLLDDTERCLSVQCCPFHVSNRCGLNEVFVQIVSLCLLLSIFYFWELQRPEVEEMCGLQRLQVM